LLWRVVQPFPAGLLWRVPHCSRFVGRVGVSAPPLIILS